MNKIVFHTKTIIFWNQMSEFGELRNVNRWGRMLRYVETCLLNKKADNKKLF